METTKIINALLEKLHIEQIYQWAYTRNGKKLTMLHIHLQQESGMRFGEAKNICNDVFEKIADVHFTLYYRHEVQRFIDLGLARFVLICHPENKVYQSENSIEEISLPRMDASTMIKQNNTYLDIEVQKTNSFLKGFQFYLKEEYFAHAAFMLHQAFELSLRTGLLLLIGDEKKSHDLTSILNYCKSFESTFGKLIKKDIDAKAIQLLSSSYSAFRYNQGFQITQEQLETAQRVVEKAIDWIDVYKAEYQQEIDRKLSPSHQEEKRIEKLKTEFLEEVNAISDSNHSALILKALAIYIRPESVRCFASRNQQDQLKNLVTVLNEQRMEQRYYLCVGMDDEKVFTLDLQQKINDLLPSFLHVTLILESEKQIWRKAKRGNLFFYNLLENAEVWALKSNLKDDYESLLTPHQSNTYLLKQWTVRLENAKTLLEIYHNTYGTGIARAVTYGMVLALEQAYLGLIKIFLGYTSPIVNLNYLTRLVEIIDPKLCISNNGDDSRNQRIFQILLEAQQKFKHAPNYSVDTEWSHSICEKVDRIIKEADRYVNDHFKTQTKESTEDGGCSMDAIVEEDASL